MERNILTISINHVAEIQNYSMSELSNAGKIRLGGKEFTVSHYDGNFSISRDNASFASKFKSFYGGNTTAKQLETLMNQRSQNSDAVFKAMPEITSKVEQELEQFDIEDRPKLEKKKAELESLKADLQFTKLTLENKKKLGDEWSTPSELANLEKKVVKLEKQIEDASRKLGKMLLSNLLSASIGHTFNRLTTELQAKGFNGDHPVNIEAFERVSQLIIENKEAYGLSTNLDGSEVTDTALRTKLEDVWKLPKSQINDSIQQKAELARPVKGVVVKETAVFREQADNITQKHTGPMLSDVMDTLKDILQAKEAKEANEYRRYELDSILASV